MASDATQDDLHHTILSRIRAASAVNRIVDAHGDDADPLTTNARWAIRRALNELATALENEAVAHSRYRSASLRIAV